MPWTTPVSPVSGTVITVAWATANVVNPQNWLRLMTGNSDPPGSSYVVVSGSTTSTAWGKVTSDVLADGSVTALKIPAGTISNAHLVGGTAALNLAGTTVNGVLTIAGSGAGLVIHGSAGMLNDGAAGTTLSGTGPHTLGGTGGVFVTNTAGMVVSGAAGLSVSSSGGVQVTNTLNAGTLQQSGAGVALASHASHPTNLVLLTGQVIQFQDTLAPKINLFSTTFGIGINSGQLVLFAPSGNPVVVRDGSNSGTLLGQVALQNAAGKVPASIAADTVGGHSVGTGFDTIPVSNGTINPNLAAGSAVSANTIGGLTPTATPGPGRIPISDATGTLNAWVLGSGVVVPVDAVIGWDNAGTIPAGWTRFTAADGRLLIGAGTSFAVAWAQGVSYPTSGGSWSHDHVTTTITPTSTFSGTAGNTSASAATNGLATAGGVSLNTTAHTHPFTPSGTVSTTLSGNVGDTSWQPAMRGIVWIKRV